MPRLSSLTLPALGLALATSGLTVAVAPDGATAAESARVSLDRRLADREIRESSGLARSTYARRLVWTHNDSGDSTRLFAVRRNGETRAVMRVEGARARDWEDIAAGPRHTLWIGDIGDNRRSRARISVYRVKEPRRVRPGALQATRFDFTYPDGPHDAEGLMVKPRSGRLFIISKSGSGGAVYRAPRQLSTSSVNELVRVRATPRTVTAAAWRPGGGFALVNYSKAYVYEKLRSAPTVYDKPDLRQGESAEFDRDGSSLLLGSEGTDSPVYRLGVG
jgi:hypothetical protein